MRSSSAGSKSAAISAAVEMLVGLLQRVDGGVDRLHRGLDQRGELPARRSSRRTAADSAATGE